MEQTPDLHIKEDDGELNNFTYLKCADFENIYDAIEHYQQTNNLDIENMSIALASHTTKDAIKFLIIITIQAIRNI